MSADLSGRATPRPRWVSRPIIKAAGITIETQSMQDCGTGHSQLSGLYIAPAC